MTGFKPHFRKDEGVTNILRAWELPETVKDGVQFHKENGFLDYFCSDNVTGRFIFRFLDLNRYFVKNRVNPCDVAAQSSKSGGWKWDLNWRDWLEKRGKGNILTVLADESVALPPQINIAFTTYEVYIRKTVLCG